MKKVKPQKDRQTDKRAWEAQRERRRFWKSPANRQENDKGSNHEAVA